MPLKQHDIQSALTTPRSEQTQSQTHPVSISPFNPMGILSSPSYTQFPSSYHPTTSTAVQLWNQYLNNVVCCNKVVHTPTTEAIIYSTIDTPAAASFENLALCFSIYYAATASLDPEEAKKVLGIDRISALGRFKLGMEQALAHADFLDEPTVTTLSALAIFQVFLASFQHYKLSPPASASLTT